MGVIGRAEKYSFPCNIETRLVSLAQNLGGMETKKNQEIVTRLFDVEPGCNWIVKQNYLLNQIELYLKNGRSYA